MPRNGKLTSTVGSAFCRDFTFYPLRLMQFLKLLRLCLYRHFDISFQTESKVTGAKDFASRFCLSRTPVLRFTISLVAFTAMYCAVLHPFCVYNSLTHFLTLALVCSRLLTAAPALYRKSHAFARCLTSVRASVTGRELNSAREWAYN